MPGTLLPKEAILRELETVAKEFAAFCKTIPHDTFFRQPKGKWSIAQNVKHLTIATNHAKIAFLMPKFLVRLYGGRPFRFSHTYDEVVEEYKQELAEGGKATRRYIPKPISPNTQEAKMLESFSHSMEKLADAIRNNWLGPQLDRFLVPHPLLGRISLRELCYFTIYHTRHHLEIIRQRAA